VFAGVDSRLSSVCGINVLRETTIDREGRESVQMGYLLKAEQLSAAQPDVDNNTSGCLTHCKRR